MSIGPKMWTKGAGVGWHWHYVDTQDCAHVAAYYMHRARKRMEYIHEFSTPIGGMTGIAMYRLFSRRATAYGYWADDSNP